MEYICKICKEKFYTRKKFRNHVKKEHAMAWKGTKMRSASKRFSKWELDPIMTYRLKKGVIT